MQLLGFFEVLLPEHLICKNILVAWKIDEKSVGNFQNGYNFYKDCFV
jgi:hypothetical protein